MFMSSNNAIYLMQKAHELYIHNFNAALKFNTVLMVI
jgi:hypothetical protein